MIRWEYKTVSFEECATFSGGFNTDKFNQKLNLLGREGWALVSTTTKPGFTHSSRFIAVFKRAL
jgi:hypothetical protein